MIDNFKTNNIDSAHTTVAEQLCCARKEKNLSLKKVGRKININPQYLQALEEENYDKLPEGIYQTKILKKYASFLGLDAERIKEKFLKEQKTQVSDKKHNLFSVERIKKCNFLVLPKILRNAIVALVVIICFGCLGTYLHNVFAPPQLQVFQPQPNSLTTQKERITIQGKTDPETKVFINDTQVLNDQKGTFNKKIRLKEGVNIITIKAKKKYGQENTIKKQILAQEG